MSDLGTVTYYREADLDYRRERLAADFRPLLARRRGGSRRPQRAASAVRRLLVHPVAPSVRA